MRVALLSHVASPDSPTGAERSLALLAGGLERRGHSVTIVVPGAWAAAGGLAPGIEVVEHRVRCCWLVQQRPQPAWRQAVRWLRFAVPDPAARRLQAWLRSAAPDVVHVNCLPHLRGAAAAAGLPVVWHVRELLPPGGRRRWLATRLARHATRIVAVSEAVAGWLREEGLGERVEVVHNGVEAPAVLPPADEARRRLGLPVEGILVGCFGQLIGHKGILDLVAAAAELGPEVGVVLAGSGRPGFVTELERAIVRGPGRARVRLLPPRPDARELLAAVDVVAAPSRWPDPLPRIVMEAMAAGRPVVASDAGGIPEMVVDGETGFLVPPGDVAALADRLRRLAGDRELRGRMGAAGAERARREFSLERHVDRMEALLAAAAASARRRRPG